VGGDDESVLDRVAPEPDVVASYGPGPDDVADVQLGGDDRPLVVLLHGGFWRPAYDRTHLRDMAHALAAAGFTAAATEYRRTPGHPENALADVRVALRVLPVELRGRHDGRTIVVGHSAGGHLALWAAVSAPARGLVGTVALAPVADLAAAEAARIGSGAVNAFLAGTADSRRDLDPVHMASPDTPVVLIHGDDDQVVPPAQSQAYAAAHPTATLELLPGVGHFGLIDPTSTAFAAVRAAIERLAGEPSPTEG
jgi:acetyl esterase/lipase